MRSCPDTDIHPLPGVRGRIVDNDNLMVELNL